MYREKLARKIGTAYVIPRRSDPHSGRWTRLSEEAGENASDLGEVFLGCELEKAQGDKLLFLLVDDVQPPLEAVLLGNLCHLR